MSEKDRLRGNDPIIVPSYTENVIIDEERRPGGDDEAPLIADGKIFEDAAGTPVFRDVPFAILFLVHLGIMLWAGIFVAPKGLEKLNLNDWNLTAIEEQIREQSEDVTEKDIEQMEDFIKAASEYLRIYPIRIVLYLVLPCLLLAFLLASIVTSFVIKPNPKPFVYSSLIGSVLATILIMVPAAVASRAIFMYMVTGAALVAVLYYVRIAWRMVPFAAVNLKVALEGIGRNWGMHIIAFVLCVLGFVWNIYWVYVLVGLSAFKNTECMEEHPDATFEDATCSPPAFVMILLLLSLYWTTTVLMNTVQVTVAGVMATWCFVSDEAGHCCSPAVTGSLFRSLTYSFGSICLGSLLQAIVSVLRYMAESARRHREAGDQQDACSSLFWCIIECLTRCLEDVIDYFNQWAYCFVGIYGLSYIESGRKVVELFRARGWTTIVTDNLVGYTLGFTTCVVAIGTGLLGLVVEHVVSSAHSDSDPESKSFIFGSIPGVKGWAFFTSFLVGIWVSSVMMNVVQGAVNTLIVCWADSPAKLELEHPVLTAEMAESWTSVFPELRFGLPTGQYS